MDLSGVIVFGICTTVMSTVFAAILFMMSCKHDDKFLLVSSMAVVVGLAVGTIHSEVVLDRLRAQEAEVKELRQACIEAGIATTTITIKEGFKLLKGEANDNH